MRIYIAGSSDELDRAEWAMRSARELGHEVTSDWVKTIREVGAGNPRFATNLQRERWAGDAMDGIYKADRLWMLMPRASAGRGAFFEFGYASWALGHENIIISGPNTHESIFCALGREFPTDAEALEFIRGLR